MKKILMVLAAILIFQPSAFAKWIDATVTDVDQKSNTLKVQPLEAADQALPQEFQVKLTKNVKFKNIASIADLKEGNEVRVDIKENQNIGVWEAGSVELKNSGDNRGL